VLTILKKLVCMSVCCPPKHAYLSIDLYQHFSTRFLFFVKIIMGVNIIDTNPDVILLRSISIECI
jgi:hypothetical protein